MPLTLTRDEFLQEYWDYRPGEHVSFIEPTGGGKTHLAYQCLDAAMRQNPQLRTVSLMPKPTSPSTEKWAAALQLEEIGAWPPPARFFWKEKPRGFVLWPPHRKDLPVQQNREQIAGQMRRCLHEQYWKGSSITFADDVYVAAVLMGLNPEMEQHWTAGREAGAGLWSANQKPSGTVGGGSVSSFSYNAPTHLFLGTDNDDRNTRRFAEIGAGDPRELADIVRSLRVHEIDGNAVSEKLYLDKRGPYKSIIMPW